MFKRTITTALAVVGLAVGAGFASGREVIQYFVSFGTVGLVGAVLAAILFAIMCGAVLQLGSYFRATEHSEVFNAVATPFLSRALDAFIVFTLFATGFVMIAGAGANLNQQFGAPVWFGSFLLTLLVIIAGMLDVRRVTAVIGVITPVIIVFILAAGVYSFTHPGGSFVELAAIAEGVPTTLPHWFISSLNYVAMGFALAVSMAIVMGGDLLDPKSAGIGGLVGGGVYGILLLLTTFALFFNVNRVAFAEMPTLQLVNLIHPVLGTVMAAVIFGMIFNTAIGMYYALTSRVVAKHPERFRPTIIILSLSGFALSFIGFGNLVSYLFPLIGYVGIAICLVIFIGWWEMRPSIVEEIQRRTRIRYLFRKKLDRSLPYSKKEERQLRRAIRTSNIDDPELWQDVSDEVIAEIESEESVSDEESRKVTM